jgi:hypothetical protein
MYKLILVIRSAKQFLADQHAGELRGSHGGEDDDVL